MSNPTRRPSGSSTILRSHSPSRRFQTSSSSSFPKRSASPTRVNLYGPSSSPSYSSSVKYTRLQKKPLQQNSSASPRRMCTCSPTSHPGSFRCSLHKNTNTHSTTTRTTTSFPSNRLNARRSAMTNSLVRIGTVEGGDLVKRALSALIRPSSHQQRRRTSFQRIKSRLSVMTSASEI